MVLHSLEMIRNEINNSVSRYFITILTAFSTIYYNPEYKHEDPTLFNGGRAISIGGGKQLKNYEWNMEQLELLVMKEEGKKYTF